MRRLLIAALFVAPSLAPSLVAAQRGASSQAAKHTDAEPPAPPGPTLRVHDIEDMSPIKLLIDKRKDLKLNDTQLSGLKAAEPKLKDENAPLLKQVDSLMHELRPAGPTADDRNRSIMTAVKHTVDAVRVNYDAAVKDALATLEPEQQTKANELLAKQHEESEKILTEKMGSGRHG